MIDTIELAQGLIKCPSVTPADEGALDVLQTALEGLGFRCQRLPFGEGAEGPNARVDNLYARLGTASPNFCFAGHTDVVPTGDVDQWSVDPFAGQIKDGVLFGRGASDMKGAIAAFVAAVDSFLSAHGQPAALPGSISLLITGDEEGDALNGTKKMLEWLKAQGEQLDMCLVGEPTNPTALGEMIKIGRRGSLTGTLTVHGVQGHTAYPHLADNPTHRLVHMLEQMVASELDQGSDHFQPSTVQISTIDVGNPASNVIPGKASATFNIRFNDRHSGEQLESWLRELFDRAIATPVHNGPETTKSSYDLAVRVSGESFLSDPGQLATTIADAAEAALGRRPEFSTTGGTSDARFIHKVCEVAEFGAIGLTMHKIDEQMPVADLRLLSDIYRGVLDRIFSGT